MSVASERLKTEEWYARYYRRKGKDRNDLWANPEVHFQHFASEYSVLEVLRTANLDRQSAHVLDVGCGGGGSLLRFLAAGFPPENLYGIDIVPSRIEEAQTRHPSVKFSCGDAAHLPYDADSFDLVMESTMFVQLTEEELSTQIASEMLRVTAPGGYLLLVDWRYSKPGVSSYLGLSTRRIRRLFGVGSETALRKVKNGALVPPIGRRLSRFLPSAYFLVQTAAPFLAGQRAVLLQKRAA